MISKEHHKHPKLLRPVSGHFGRREWAIHGAPCGVIQALAKKVIEGLSAQFQCAYVDAKHLNPEAQAELPGMLAAGASMEYTDAINHRQLTVKAAWSEQQARAVFTENDLVLVNGNHHMANAQVVIIDPEKAESLKRRLGQLTNVRLVIIKDKGTPVFDFLQHAFPEILQVPTLLLQDIDAIVQFFEQEVRKNTPVVNGLVLAGGQSIRMGRDKGAIEWHGQPQRDYLVDLLRPFCAEVYISCRAEQQSALQGNTPALPDTFLDLGPFGGLLSAFRTQPDRAWLVVACDLPLLDESTIAFLMQERRTNKIATAFQSTTDQLPEPLITIWEPKSYPVLLSFLAQGYSCLRKVLINTDTQILTVPNPEALQNVNTPEDLEQMLRRPGFKLAKRPEH